MTESSANPSLSRRRFLKLSALAAGGGLALYSGMWERHHLELLEETIHLPRLPEAFHGLRIAQISDIHYDEYTEPYFVREVVAHINALQPDVVVLTGDFISYGPLPRHIAARLSYQCAEILQDIACPHRFASLGNHDAIVNWEMVTDALKVHGTPTLLNAYLPLERDGARLWFAGTRSAVMDYPNLDKAIPASATANEPVILLAHEPDYVADVVTHGGVSLMLSGHTHGGQIRLPFIGTPHAMLPPGGQKYVHGRFRVGPVELYVNRGIGTVHVPVRFRCPPELTILTLQPSLV